MKHGIHHTHVRTTSRASYTGETTQPSSASLQRTEGYYAGPYQPSLSPRFNISLHHRRHSPLGNIWELHLNTRLIHHHYLKK